MKRTEFEHHFLPLKAYENESTVISDLIETCPGWLRRVYSTMSYQRLHLFSENFGLTPFYFIENDDAVVILRLELPEATSVLECRYIYLCQSARKGQLMYFTSELSESGSFYLCAWTKRHTHMLLSMDKFEDETRAVYDYYRQLAGYEPIIDDRTA